MLELRIDFKEFFRQHYWMGRYFWNNCYDHRLYKSHCLDCNAGEWKYIKWSDQRRGKSLPMGQIRIYKMPMNNVVHQAKEDAEG